MNDQSLLRDLELFQEMSEQEFEAVSGGTELAQQKRILPVGSSGLGSCPACLSGLDGGVIPYMEVIKPPVNFPKNPRA
jgi:hypothetical protein